MAKKKLDISTLRPKYVAPEPVRQTDASETKWWLILIIVFFLLFMGIALWRWLYPPMAGATVVLPPCGTETYYFYNEGSNSRVAVNVHNSDEEIDVTGLNGWSVSNLWLDQEGGGTNYINFGSGNKDDFNPSPNFYDIEKVKVEVTKACPTPTPTPTPEPVCEQTEWSCQACQTLEDNVCYKDQQNFCEEAYNCGWSECEVNGDAKLLEQICEPEWVCEDTCEPEVTPTPTNPPTREESKPEGCTHDCGVPACTDSVPKEVANPHIYRKGDCAIVKWWPTEGNKANIYWKENSSGDWQHALAGVDNTGYREVCGLSNLDYTFGVQSVNGCAADGIVNASNLSVVVDGATNGWVLFR